MRGSGPQVGRWLWERYNRGLPQDVINAACDEHSINIEEHPLPISGLLWADDEDRYFMFVNAAESPQRQMFTMAHELIHYFKDADARSFYESGDEDTVREREANAGAGEIILPLEEAQALAERIAGDLSGPEVSEVARARGISMSAVRTRLQFLQECGWVVRPRELVVWHDREMFLDRSLREEWPVVTGVVTGWRFVRRLWRKDHTCPACCSPDNIHGFGAPGGACSQCELSLSDHCHRYCEVYLLQPEEPFPAKLLLPPSASGEWERYAVGTAWTGGQLTEFQLETQQTMSAQWCEVHIESVTVPGVTPLYAESSLLRNKVNPYIIPVGEERRPLFRAPSVSPAVLRQLADCCEQHGGKRAAEELRRDARVLLGA